MALSSYSNTSLEDVAAQRQGNPMAMHVCVMQDRRITERVAKRAEGRAEDRLREALRLEAQALTSFVIAARYKALFISVDVPMLGRRLNEYRNDFSMPVDLKSPNLQEGDQPGVMGKGGGEGYEYGRMPFRCVAPPCC